MTLTDLYRKTLEKLTVTAASEDAEPSDVQLISSKYAALYDMLLTEGLVAWTVTEDVPEFAVLPLVAMLAYMSAGEFGQDPARYAAEGALGLPQLSLAERQLRRQLAKTYVSHTAQSEYF
jgi:hypothetical protein